MAEYCLWLTLLSQMVIVDVSASHSPGQIKPGPLSLSLSLASVIVFCLHALEM